MKIEEETTVRLHGQQRNKIKKYFSFLDIINEKLKTNYSPEDFVLNWGEQFVHFREEKTFLRMYKIGFSLWQKMDDGHQGGRKKRGANLVLGSWSEHPIHLLVSDKQVKDRKIHIFDEIFLVTDESYVRTQSCSTDGCYFTAKSAYHLARHEKTCRTESETKYIQKCYGNQTSVRDQLIQEGIITPDDPSFKNHMAFDIESLACEEQVEVYGAKLHLNAQRCITIGYCTNFNDDEGVITRTDMSRKAGTEMVSTFINKMRQIQCRHYETIPTKIKEEIARVKLEMTDKNLSPRKRSELFLRRSFLTNLCKLKVIGFNSSSYDIPWLVILCKRE